MARPVQLAKGSKFIVLASVCVVVGALYFAREVLVPLALAILLTFLLAPLVRRLERLGLGRVPATLVVVLLGLGLVGVIGYVVEQQFVQIADELPGYTGQIRHKVQAFLGGGGGSGIGSAVKKVEKTFQDVSPGKPTTGPGTQPTTQPATQPAEATAATSPPAPDHTGEPTPAPPTSQPAVTAVLPYTPDNPLPVRDFPEPPSPVKQAIEYVGIALSPLATAGLVIIFVIFMLITREDLRDRMIRLVGYGRLHVTTQAMDDAASRISRYLLSQALINTCYGVLVAGGLWSIGHLLGHGRSFPSVLLWGLLAGLLRFVPYIGPWIGAAGPLVVAFGFFQGNAVFLACVGWWVLLELIASQVIEPLVYGSSTGMSTLAVLVSAVFWTWLWGPVGLLLSTPLTAVLVVMGKYIPQLQFLDVLLGDEPVLEPPVRVYQRLLAMDQEEAAELVRTELTTKPLLDVYDQVLLPALSLAEQDRHRGELDDERYDFIHNAMRSMIDELGDLSRQEAHMKAADDAVAMAKGEPVEPGGNGKADAAATSRDAAATAPAGASAASPPGLERPTAVARLPQGCTVNIVCLPAHDEADEIANLMLVQLLEEYGYCAFSASQDQLASEMIESIEGHAAHAVVVSALPPAAVSHARYLCKRIHGKFGDDRNMVVGLWTARGDLDKARERITCAGTVRLVTAFRDTLHELHQLVQPAILQAATSAGEQDARRDPPAVAASKSSGE
jgi:predicted PurR-regulated permease PerM